MATKVSVEGLLNAETDLLGALLLDASLIAEVDGQLVPADLTGPQHTAILQRMLDAAARNEPLSVSTIGGEDEQLRGAVARLAQVERGMVPAEARAVVRRLRAHANRRRVLVAMGAASRKLAVCDAGEVGRVVDAALGDIMAATAASDEPEASSATDLCAEAFRAATDRTPPDAVTTGIPDLDFHTSGGLHRGNVIAIGARTSVGKTALAVAMARRAAESGAAVLYVSLEMSRAEIGDRLLAQVANLNLRELRARHLTGDELRRAADAQNQVRAWGNNLEVVDHGVRTVSALGSMLRRRAALRRPVRVLMLDYAQLLRPARADSLREGYTVISRELKALARETGISLVVLAQLRREAEVRPDSKGRHLRRPSLADLKETGAWEEDSDIVILLWRDNKFGDIRAELDKNRHGESGVTVRLAWDAPSATLCGLPEREALKPGGTS